MSNFSFTKLFSSITESTIWAEPDHVRIVWITMLAMCDRQGRVYATIPGLAGRARVSVEQCEEALAKFLAPDKYSRSKEFDGRRIQETDGGWVLLNYERYRELRDSEADKERKKKWAAKNRAYQKSRLSSSTVDPSRHGVDQSSPKAEGRSQSTEDREERKAKFAPPSVEEVEAEIRGKGYTFSASRFVDFYETKGWMVGKNPMRDWHAAMRTWQASEVERGRKALPLISEEENERRRTAAREMR